MPSTYNIKRGFKCTKTASSGLPIYHKRQNYHFMSPKILIMIRYMELYLGQKE